MAVKKSAIVPEVEGFETVALGDKAYLLYPIAVATAAKAKAKAAEAEEEADEDDDEEGEALDRDELMGTDLRTLKKMARDDYELEVEAGVKKAALVDAILEAAGGEDGEEDDEEDEDDEDGDDEGYTEEELEDLSLADLKAVAKEYEIDLRGKKAPALIEAILEAQEGDEDEDDEDEDDDDEEDGDEVTEEDLLEMDLPDLVALAKENGIKITIKQKKNKKLLVNAIVEALSEEDDEDE